MFKQSLTLEIKNDLDRNFPFSKASLKGLHALIRFWEDDFNELVHPMSFQKAHGFLPRAEEIHNGWVFQLAVLTNILYECSAYGVEISPLLLYPSYRAIQKAKRDNDGWSYFENLIELPCDIDTFAEIYRLQTYLGEEGDDLAHTHALVARILEQGDGILKSTWIPSNDILTQQLQDQYIESHWGDTLDCEVNANFFNAIAQRPTAYAKFANEACGALAAFQKKDGSWPCTWYTGDYYSVFQHVRLLTGYTDYGEELKNALNFLRTALHNRKNDRNPLDLAYAVQALCLLHSSEIATDKKLLVTLIQQLKQCQNEDGTWNAQPWIVMNTSRTTGGTFHVFYGSQTMTTAITTKALLAYEAITAQ